MDAKAIATGIVIGGVVATIVHRLNRGKTDQHLSEFVSAMTHKPSERETNGIVEVSNADISAEQFVRNDQFFGEDGQSKVFASRVIVVGVGGVGSHCAVTLARSGVGAIRLVDFDRVTVSSLNRHASAVRSDVGIPKVSSLK